MPWTRGEESRPRAGGCLLARSIPSAETAWRLEVGWHPLARSVRRHRRFRDRPTPRRKAEQSAQTACPRPAPWLARSAPHLLALVDVGTGAEAVPRPEGRHDLEPDTCAIVANTCRLLASDVPFLFQPIRPAAALTSTALSNHTSRGMEKRSVRRQTRPSGAAGAQVRSAGGSAKVECFPGSRKLPPSRLHARGVRKAMGVRAPPISVAVPGCGLRPSGRGKKDTGPGGFRLSCHRHHARHP